VHDIERGASESNRCSLRAPRRCYTRFNAGAVLKVKSDAASRGATLAKRIVTETEVTLLIRAAPSKRDRVLLEVAYAGGLRVSEIVAVTWAEVLPREKQRVQLSIVGKGSKVRHRCSCPRSSADPCYRYAATPTPMIPCSPAVKVAAGCRRAPRPCRRAS
jgi:integrase